MIGLGKWTGKVNTMFFAGDITFCVNDNNGQYDFSMDLPEGVSKLPDVTFSDIREDGNSLYASAEIALLPGKKVDATLTFEGDTMSGLIKIPFIGKVKLDNFKKID